MRFLRSGRATRNSTYWARWSRVGLAMKSLAFAACVVAVRGRAEELERELRLLGDHLAAGRAAACCPGTRSTAPRCRRSTARWSRSADAARSAAAAPRSRPDPGGGVGEAGGPRQRAVDVAAQAGVGRRVAPVDEALLDDAVEPREPGRERGERVAWRRAARAARRRGRSRRRRCGCPSRPPRRSPSMNACTAWRLRRLRTWLSITPSTRKRWRAQSWSGSGSGAIWPPASETRTVRGSRRSRARGCRRRRRRRGRRARGTRRGRGRCRPRRPRPRRVRSSSKGERTGGNADEAATASASGTVGAFTRPTR